MSSPASKTPPPASKPPVFWDKVKKRPDPLTSVALTIPVFLIYHLGILVVDRRSGVDLVSKAAFGLMNIGRPAYVIATLGVALLLATVVWIEERRGAATKVSLTRVLLEGAVFAVAAVAAFGWAISRALRARDLSDVAELSLLEKVVLACGTGFHEEFVFRATLVSGLAFVLAKVIRMSARAALTIAVVVSSIAFSLVHNYGPFGEPFLLDVAAIRVVLGGLFAALYLLRGFASVVYAHAFFQLLVFFLYT
jgi:Type II CAAX prenyl endopeptidase Rce1-like